MLDDERYVPCPTCPGAGRIIQYRFGRSIRCPTCLGAGKVTEQFLREWNDSRGREIERQPPGGIEYTFPEPEAPNLTPPRTPPVRHRNHLPACTCVDCSRIRMGNIHNATRRLIEPLNEPSQSQLGSPSKPITRQPAEPPANASKPITRQPAEPPAKWNNRRQIRRQSRGRVSALRWMALFAFKSGVGIAVYWWMRGGF